MKIEKNKIVFAVVILCVVLFIGSYTIIVLGEDEEPVIENNKIPMPKLEDSQKEYKSKLEALDDFKKVRETNAPSIYDERLLDSMGVYDPNFLEKEKLRIVDSIYQNEYTEYAQKDYEIYNTQNFQNEEKPGMSGVVISKNEYSISIQELGLEHQLFFASNPKMNEAKSLKHGTMIPVIVDGTQTVKANYRLRMRLMADTQIDSLLIPRNTLIYGFVSFQPNRIQIDIETINHYPTNLKAYDYQDGSEGIYIENSFRADATREVLDDIVQDINIAGVPQVGGVKKIFQRNNRNAKVTVLNNCKLILKAANRH